MTQILRYTGGNILSYAEYGDQNGFPVLVQHGLIASIQDVALFEPLLKVGARLICMARPGYGESTPFPMETVAGWAEIVSGVVEKLGLARFDVLGMSSGAPYSYAIGYAFPEKVRNIYIFSGTPALFDDEILARWPFPVNRQASIAEMQKLAKELFFSNCSEADLARADIQDSMRNDCFGIGLDFKIRCLNWGFALSMVKECIYMRHSKRDPSVPFITAAMTARLLPDCRLEIKESDVHFSAEALDEFIRETIAAHL